MTVTYDLEFGPVLNIALEYKPNFLLNWFMILRFCNLHSKLQFSESNFTYPVFNSVALPHIFHAQALFYTFLLLATSGISGCC